MNLQQRSWLVVLAACCTSAVAADNRVLIIGIDGAGGSYTRDYPTPNLDALAAAGSARYDFLNEGGLTANAPSGYGASGVNWSTILTGVGGPSHGVSDNSFSGSRFDVFPSLLHYVKQQDPAAYTASVSGWNPINTQIVGDADLKFGGAADPVIRDVAVDLLTRQDPTAVFVHLDSVDAAGHGFGWGSPQYQEAIVSADGMIGDVLAAVGARPGVASGEEDWLVIVTADHGGQGTSHFASQGPINWEVPFIVSGPSVPNGQPMQQGSLRDVAATALWHLGIDPFELGLKGTIRGLAVAPPNGVFGDTNQDGVLSGDGRGPAATDDVTALLDHWLSQGAGSLAARYSRGDLNFDGITDLGDWALLNRLNPAIGLAALSSLQRRSIPEPTGLWSLSAVVAATLGLLRPSGACTRAAPL